MQNLTSESKAESLFLVILVINKQNVFDTSCFEYFQFIFQLFLHKPQHINVVISNFYTLYF